MSFREKFMQFFRKCNRSNKSNLDLEEPTNISVKLVNIQLVEKDSSSLSDEKERVYLVRLEKLDSFLIVLEEALPPEKLALEIRINCYPKKISMKEQYYIMQEIEALHYKPFKKA